jgi:hypothetical protein
VLRQVKELTIVCSSFLRVLKYFSGNSR